MNNRDLLTLKLEEHCQFDEPMLNKYLGHLIVLAHQELFELLKRISLI
tara:strand:- start:75 stop:218 length:144 start_codon:yes stop_codon:yes gene_type:complete